MGIESVAFIFFGGLVKHGDASNIEGIDYAYVNGNSFSTSKVTRKLFHFLKRKRFMSLSSVY